MTERLPHRQLCDLCQAECRVDFSVPDDVWELAVHASQLSERLCLDCFTRLADARFIEWDQGIEFYPATLVRQFHIVWGTSD